MKPLTLILQRTNCDIVVAFDEAQNTLNTLKGLRTQISILPNNYGEQQCTLPFLTTLTMNPSADFLLISDKWCLVSFWYPASSKTSVIDELSTVFREDLSDLATWRPEIARWRIKFLDGYENIPISLQQSLNYAHKNFYPNIKRIFIILPVTSVYSERPFSYLRRLKTWERATMGEERLCGLAMLHILRDFMWAEKTF